MRGITAVIGFVGYCCHIAWGFASMTPHQRHQRHQRHQPQAAHDDVDGDSDISRRAAILFPIGVVVAANAPFLMLMASPPDSETLDGTYIKSL